MHQKWRIVIEPSSLNCCGDSMSLCEASSIVPANNGHVFAVYLCTLPLHTYMNTYITAAVYLCMLLLCTYVYTYVHCCILMYTAAVYLHVYLYTLLLYTYVYNYVCCCCILIYISILVHIYVSFCH